MADAEAHPMNGGDGLDSYFQNSNYQRGVVDAAKEYIFEAIIEKLDLINPIFETSEIFHIADFGCSTGPNTFIAMQNIVDAVHQKYAKTGLTAPKFQVFFNDHVSNDFNVLFQNLPPSREYFAAGVPGSFYSRLFPKASLEFMHCSYALQWLSKVPNEIQDVNSAAWNKGKILYTGIKTHVCAAYSNQFQKDFDTFLKARAYELVGGGLMVIQMPTIPSDEILFTRTGAGLLIALLGDSLMDFAKLGEITEEKVDSFNLPTYHPSLEELKMVIEKNGSFTIEKIGPLNHPMRNIPFDVKMTSTQVRAIMAGIVEEHFGFGNKTTDKLFEIYTDKLQKNYDVFDKEIRKDVDFCLVLKRKIK